jgi:hypothetical protein
LRPDIENDEVRAMTRRPGSRVSALMISSANPSLKYSFSLSALRLANGRTASDFARAGSAAVALRPESRSRFRRWRSARRSDAL